MRILLLAFVLLSLSSCQRKMVNSNSKPITHEIWNGLLKKHVSSKGIVSYKGFQEDRDTFEAYLKLLRNNHPNEGNWSREERLAYWINAYNAFTIDLVLEHYPLASIKDIKKGIPFISSVWDIRFIEIEGKKYDLNGIEHSILRKEFDEPRIHFAIVCASYSCPDLRNEAFTAARLNEQLEEQAVFFINDFRKNTIRPDNFQISKIFSWFKNDFTKKMSLIEYLNQYSLMPIPEGVEPKYMDYDWKLNDK